MGSVDDATGGFRLTPSLEGTERERVRRARYAVAEKVAKELLADTRGLEIRAARSRRDRVVEAYMRLMRELPPVPRADGSFDDSAFREALAAPYLPPMAAPDEAVAPGYRPLPKLVAGTLYRFDGPPRPLAGELPDRAPRDDDEPVAGPSLHYMLDRSQTELDATIRKWEAAFSRTIGDVLEASEVLIAALRRRERNPSPAEVKEYLAESRAGRGAQWMEGKA